MKEKWRWVKDRKGHYQVSDQGRVRSVDRVYRQMGRWGTFYDHHKKGVVLRPALNPQGYPTVVIAGRGTCQVHALVAEAFLGPRKKGQECRHKDGTRTNAKRDNLCYGTRLDNINDSRKHGTFKKRYDRWRHLTLAQIKAVQREYKKSKNLTHKKLGVKYGVSEAVIFLAVNGRYAFTA